MAVENKIACTITTGHRCLGTTSSRWPQNNFRIVLLTLENICQSHQSIVFRTKVMMISRFGPVQLPFWQPSRILKKKTSGWQVTNQPKFHLLTKYNTKTKKTIKRSCKLFIIMGSATGLWDVCHVAARLCSTLGCVVR